MTEPDRSRRFRVVAGWAAVAVAAAVLGGWIPGIVAVALAGWHLVRPPRPRIVLGLAAAVLALVPAAWLLGNADRLGLASPLVVLANRTPGTLAAVGLLLLVVGVYRDTARPRPTPSEEAA
jgi:MFS family permease